jgi:hypothetical protein
MIEKSARQTLKAWNEADLMMFNTSGVETLLTK